jgi:hypothetical protein
MGPPLITSGKGYADDRIGELVVQATARAVTDDEWREHCGNLAKLNAEGGPYRAMLIFGAGPGPTSRQRQILAEEYSSANAQCARTVLLTDSPVARGVLVAIGWLLDAKVKAFSTNDLDKAITWLAPVAKFDPLGVRSALLGVIRGCGAKPPPTW